MKGGSRTAVVAVCALVLAVLAATLAPGEEPSGPWTAPAQERSTKNPVAATTESLGRGRELYARYCLACHGEKGEGKGPVAMRLGFTAGDLTDGARMTSQTDGEIFWKIATGRDPMPSFKKDKGLSDAQIWDLVNHVRTLAPAAPARPADR